MPEFPNYPLVLDPGVNRSKPLFSHPTSVTNCPCFPFPLLFFIHASLAAPASPFFSLFDLLARPCFPIISARAYGPAARKRVLFYNSACLPRSCICHLFHSQKLLLTRGNFFHALDKTKPHQSMSFLGPCNIGGRNFQPCQSCGSRSLFLLIALLNRAIDSGAIELR